MANSPRATCWPACSSAALRADEAAARRTTGCSGSASAGFGDRYPHQLSGGMRKRTALAQTLVLDPDIILMDEPFSALDIQTRQLMENEVLELWAAKTQGGAVHHARPRRGDRDERPRRRAVGRPGVASDRRIRRSTCARPRDVAEVRVTSRFIDLHKAIWDVLREEVLKGYAQQKQAA